MSPEDPAGPTVPVGTADDASPPPGWEVRWCDVDGVRTRYALCGAAERPPLLLLHGIGRSLEDWELSAGLGSGFRVLAPDMVGFGRTGKPAGPYSLGRLARFVLAFAELHAGARPLALVGHSLGGAVALRAAVERPDRVGALALVAPAGFGREVALGLRLASLPLLGELMARPSRRVARATERLLYTDPAFATPERIARALDLAREPGAARAYLSTLRSVGDPRGVKRAWRRELHRRLAAAPPPMLIVWGADDRVLPAAQLGRAAELYPHARTELLPATGHLPQIEAAAAFHAALSEFLAAHA